MKSVGDGLVEFVIWGIGRGSHGCSCSAGGKVVIGEVGSGVGEWGSKATYLLALS